ncbi:MAG: rubredoxin [Acutalibacteraceae bacterium]
MKDDSLLIVNAVITEVDATRKPYPEGASPPGTPWSEVPEDFECPLCDVGKDCFEEA